MEKQHISYKDLIQQSIQDSPKPANFDLLSSHVETQQSWPDDTALKKWRRDLKRRVYLQDAFKANENTLCLFDEMFPTHLHVNSATLFHELAHLLFEQL